VFDLYNEDQVFTLSIFHYPSISSRGSYEVPYDTVVGTFRGDSWYDAAKIYRRWALEQPWVQHGPLSERQDVPGWWKDLYGVLRLEFAQGSTQRTIERALRLASSLQAAAGSREMLFFVWGWEKGGVFRDQPVWFPPGIGEERFADFVSNAHDVGARVIPYFTPNTVDVTTQAYEEHWIDAQVVDQWGARVDWRLQGTGGEVNWTWICPAVEGWKDYNVEQIDELVDRYDVDGVYLDILSASPPMECYDESHGHPLGGGAWWTSHSLETADLLRQAGREHDPGFVAFGEMFNEHFISHLDGFWDLSVNNYLQDWWWHVNTYGAETVPLFEFVYHPYTRIITGDWPAPYREWGQWYYYTMGYWFVSGGAVGVAISERAPEPAMWDFTTVMMEASSGYAKDFLVFGQMIEPPALDVPTVRLTQDDVPSYKQLHVRDGTLEVPSVLNSAWRAPDGSVGHVLANILPNQVPVKITLDSCGLDAKSYGIYAYRNGEYVVEETNVALPHEVHMDLRPHEIVVIGIVEGPISEPSPTATATRPPTPTLTTVPSPTSTTVPLPTYTATARPSPTCTTTMVSKPTSTSAVAPTPSWPVTLAPTTDIGRASQGDDGAEGASLTLGSPGDQDRLSVVLSIVGAAVVLIVVGWLLYARRLRIRHGRE
jgi:hypothetical protein